MNNNFFLKSDNPQEIENFLVSHKKSTTSSFGDMPKKVMDIIKEVEVLGDTALKNFTKEFDGVNLTQIEVDKQEITKALNNTDRAFLNALEQAHDNIYAFHSNQKQSGFWMTDKKGVVLGQKVTPLDRIGIYAPGGTASYPSSVLMGAIPAKIAGVTEIILISPPNETGQVNSSVLAAAALAGVNRVFNIGGAHGIAALAFGTKTVPAVDKIVGPGNAYVAIAKQLVQRFVAIDSIAGPSEVLIIADDSANPAYIAADILAQAEHDIMSRLFLVCKSESVHKSTYVEIEKQLKTLPRKDIATKALENFCVIETSTLDLAATTSNMIAPEHLQIMTSEPFAILSQIKHAGSIFLGHFSPEALGDYFAGVNHVLPTAGTARFSSGLSVDDFIKKSSVIYYNKEALLLEAQKIARLARTEGLDGHARSVEIRGEKS